MQTTTTQPAASTDTANLADLTCAQLCRPSYIENARRKWEARRAGDLIRMFAVGGYDVVKDRKNNGEEIAGAWIVRNQRGDVRAFILSHASIPGFAYAFTAS